MVAEGPPSTDLVTALTQVVDGGPASGMTRANRKRSTRTATDMSAGTNRMSTYADVDFGQSAWPVPSLRRLAVASVVTVGLGFGGLLTWASLAPLDSAVSVDGLFVAAGKRKTVTLLEGGILKTLLVKEGDHVSAGQRLLLLDDVQLRATMNQVRLQY